MTAQAALRRRFKVVVTNADGSETSAPMMAWLRQHPEYLPEGIESVDDHNSQHVALQLRRSGWSSRETLDEYLLSPPGNVPPSEDTPEGDDANDAEPADEFGSFRLERELRDFLANNLHLAKVGEGLRLYQDQTQRVGVEYPTATGPIDILAIDDTGSFYVFELKRAGSPDSAIGQLTRYMGWVMQNLANGRPVYGLVVAKEITERLKLAVLPIPNAQLFEYQVAFSLKRISGRQTPSG